MKDKRTRTITWSDPAASRRKAAEITGLDFLRAIADGTVPPPPAARLVGYRLVSADPGRAVFELDPHESQFNPFASVHGGILATVLDSALTAAVLSTCGLGRACVTAGLNIDFIKPVSGSTGTVLCEATCLHAGKRLAHARAQVMDQKRTLLATATGSFLMLHVVPDSGE